MSDQDIGNRLTRLEVQVVEKWASHDKRSDERWTDLMDKFHEIAKKVGNTPCNEHVNLMLELKNRTENLEKWQNTINWAIGVVYIAIVGALIKVLL